MEPKLPRLLESGRVEVRLSSVGGTHVFEEYGIDRLLKHLLDAKEVLRPVKAGSPEHKTRLYLERKLDVARVAKIVMPYFMSEADKADEQDLEEVTVSVSSVYSACNVMAFIENLEMYEKEQREEMEQIRAKLSQIEMAIRDYPFALDTCQHGHVALAQAYDVISDVMGLPWEYGAEQVRRRHAAEKSPESV